ncbi:MAG: TlpA family protein disulfide reductase [Chryseobacterium sp.]|nr:MAG: TlpA family protein disulfide reductase [Chryseobacterium sp.]
MKKTINFIARALPCIFLWKNVLPNLLFSRRGNRQVSETIVLTQSHADLVKLLAALSLRELNLAFIKRKVILRIVCAILLCPFTLSAQKKNISKALMIGDKIPDITITKISNYKVDAIEFSQLRGKAVILDFWATYCSACIKEFPKMDEFQKRYAKHLQIFLMNAYPKDDENILKDFLIQERVSIKNFVLPIVKSDSLIREIFPIKSMPHYIWIGADGRVKAITRADQVTAPNIERLIAGLTLNLQSKKD